MTCKYIGTKVVTAWAQDRNGMPGMAVKYEDGYTSWSPDETFHGSYRAIEGHDQRLTFGDALHLLKLGRRLRRHGWSGQDTFVFLVPGSVFQVNRPPLLGIYPAGIEINYHSHIDMKTANGPVVPWVASQIDVLADDWVVVGGD